MFNLKSTCENCELIVQFTDCNLPLTSVWSEVKKRGFPKCHLYKASGSWWVNLAALAQNQMRRYEHEGLDICKVWFSPTPHACCGEQELSFCFGALCVPSSLCLLIPRVIGCSVAIFWPQSWFLHFLVASWSGLSKILNIVFLPYAKWHFLKKRMACS